MSNELDYLEFPCPCCGEYKLEYIKEKAICICYNCNEQFASESIFRSYVVGRRARWFRAREFNRFNRRSRFIPTFGIAIILSCPHKRTYTQIERRGDQQVTKEICSNCGKVIREKIRWI